MNARPRRDSNHVEWLCRAYAGALRLYPRAHRERWSVEMRQAFRARCRDAAHEKGLGRWLLAVALPDLLASGARERLASLFQLPQGDPMRQAATIASAIVLEVVGSGLIAISLIGLWHAIAVDRFAHPGAFDALTALQVMSGVAGIVLLAIGIRQITPVSGTRRG